MDYLKELISTIGTKAYNKIENSLMVNVPQKTKEKNSTLAQKIVDQLTALKLPGNATVTEIDPDGSFTWEHKDGDGKVTNYNGTFYTQKENGHVVVNPGLAAYGADKEEPPLIPAKFRKPIIPKQSEHEDQYKPGHHDEEPLIPAQFRKPKKQKEAENE